MLSIKHRTAAFGANRGQLGDTRFVAHNEQAGTGATTCRRRESHREVRERTGFLSTVIVAPLQRFRIGAKSQIVGGPSQDLPVGFD